MAVKTANHKKSMKSNLLILESQLESDLKEDLEQEAKEIKEGEEELRKCKAKVPQSHKK